MPISKDDKLALSNNASMCIRLASAMQQEALNPDATKGMTKEQKPLIAILSALTVAVATATLAFIENAPEGLIQRANGADLANVASKKPL